MELTKSEQELMELLWDADRPLSRGDILMSGRRSWKDRSIFVLINGLLEKQMIQTVGMVKSGKVYARTFAPTCSREEFCAQVLSHYSPDLPGLLSALLDRTEASEETIHQLEALLEKKKREAVGPIRR